MSAHRIPVDAVRIVPTPLEAITVHATLVINLQQISAIVLVIISSVTIKRVAYFN